MKLNVYKNKKHIKQTFSFLSKSHTITCIFSLKQIRKGFFHTWGNRTPDTVVTYTLARVALRTVDSAEQRRLGNRSPECRISQWRSPGFIYPAHVVYLFIYIFFLKRKKQPTSIIMQHVQTLMNYVILVYDRTTIKLE